MLFPLLIIGFYIVVVVSLLLSINYDSLSLIVIVIIRFVGISKFAVGNIIMLKGFL